MQLSGSKYIKILLLLAVMAPVMPAHAQNDRKHLTYYKAKTDIDTLEVQMLPPAFLQGKRKGKQWRKYYRLVHNFSKVYPYALLAKEKLTEADSTISFDKMKRRERERYISGFQKELFSIFEKPLKNLTISQGKLLLKLIDRETGVTPYNIIKSYKGRVAAGFWQGVAKFFGSDMKRAYDKEGEDKNTEELVNIYQKGEFRLLYKSIFGKNPPEPVIRPKNDFQQM